VDWDVPCFEIGWFIDKGLDGRGYAYEAALAGLGFIFDELEVRAQRVGELLYGMLRSEHNI